jgi:hypothetical protein
MENNKLVKDEIIVKGIIKSINDNKIKLEDLPEYYKTKVEEELNK